MEPRRIRENMREMKAGEFNLGLFYGADGPIDTDEAVVVLRRPIRRRVRYSPTKRKKRTVS